MTAREQLNKKIKALECFVDLVHDKATSNEHKHTIQRVIKDIEKLSSTFLNEQKDNVVTLNYHSRKQK